MINEFFLQSAVNIRRQYLKISNNMELYHNKAKEVVDTLESSVKKLEERLLEANRIELVIDSIVRAALNDEHKNQAAAWKMLMDRMAPLSHYDKARGGEKPIVQINVTSMDSIQTIEPIDGELDESD